MAKEKITAKEAIERIGNLFVLASKTEDPKLQERYVVMARKIGERARTPIPSHLKKRFCSNCNAYWVQGKNVRVRLQKSKVVYFCLQCKHYRRHPYVREQKAKRLI